MKQQLIKIEHEGLRVLTTAQLAESYGADRQQISYNFNSNISRYSEGKHYFSLSGEEKREFLDRHEIHDSSKNASVVYLWTEKGAWLHAKSLNTDQAWEAYEMLVDDYYSNKQQQLPAMSSIEMIAAIASQAVEQERRMRDVEAQVQTLTTGLTAVPDHTAVVARVNEYARWARIGHNEVYNTIYDILQARHGIDVRTRVDNERIRLNKDYFAEKGRYYSESTLKSKVNGIDVMVRNGWLDKFNEILVGLLASLKERSLPAPR